MWILLRSTASALCSSVPRCLGLPGQSVSSVQSSWLVSLARGFLKSAAPRLLTPIPFLLVYCFLFCWFVNLVCRGSYSLRQTCQISTDIPCLKHTRSTQRLRCASCAVESFLASFRPSTPTTHDARTSLTLFLCSRAHTDPSPPVHPVL